MRFTILMLFLCLAVKGQAQNFTDTLISYDLRTGVYDTIYPLSYDSSLIAAHTLHHEGSLPGVTLLPQIVDTANYVHLNVSGYSLIKPVIWRYPASEQYDITAFPIRTTLVLDHLNVYDSINTSTPLSEDCSATLIGPNYAITAAHCVARYFRTPAGTNPLLVAAGYDEGRFTTGIPVTEAVKVYMSDNFARMVDGSILGVLGEDIALIELADSIGNELGWLGIGYQPDSFYNQKIFHKFSYPVLPNTSYLDTLPTNGDTLFYEHLYLNALDEEMLGVKYMSWGRKGMSGGGTFYTNNIDEYTLHGVFCCGADFEHPRVRPKFFYAFNHIMQLPSIVISNVDKVNQVPQKALIYPNPVQDNLYIEWKGEQPELLELYSLSGTLLQRYVVNTSVMQLNLSDFPAGMYLLRYTNGDTTMVEKIIKK